MFFDSFISSFYFIVSGPHFLFTDFMFACLLFIMVCVCVVHKTYLFFVLCLEFCIIFTCFFVVVSFSSLFGLTFSFYYMLFAAGETALVLFFAFILHDLVNWAPITNKLSLSKV